MRAVCKIVMLPLSWIGTLADDPASLTCAGSVVVLRKEPVDIEVRSQSAVKLIKLRGRLNLGEAVDGMRQTFDDLMAAGDSQFVVDLAEVAMIDSSGIGLLVRCLTAAKRTGGSVKLLNPPKFAVQTLRMTGLLKLFEVFTDADQAVASTARPQSKFGTPIDCGSWRSILREPSVGGKISSAFSTWFIFSRNGKRRAAARGDTPLPLDILKSSVWGKSQSNLRGSITCG